MNKTNKSSLLLLRDRRSSVHACGRLGSAISCPSMKGRAQAPSSCESEDWGDESWTVDCPCGVNFDDGEEMVDCDECGVWVHTSCCRILKGHTSYVCDKCKSKKKKKESEETEVAQLLVELPSKTPAFDEKIMEKTDFYPFRTDANLSMDERAHVQGIPGGDARLFVGVSQVFSRQLWKCTGYVPKMLRFAYHELPEWSNEKVSSSALFADTADKQLDNLAVGSTKEELSKPEEETPLEADVLQLLVAQMEPNQAVKERHSKREVRKESKHRLRVHGLKEDKGHQPSKRRRDDSGKKDTASRKRATNSSDCYQGNEDIAKKVPEDALVGSRFVSKDPRAMRKFAVQNFLDAVDEDSKDNVNVEMPGVPESLGHTVKDPGLGRPETSVNHDFSKPLDSLRNSNRESLSEDVYEDREELSGLCLTPSLAYRSSMDPVLHQEEAQHHQKEMEGSTLSKTMSPAGVDVDTLALKDHVGGDSSADVKTALGDPTDSHQRFKCTLLVSTKQQFEEVMHEQPDPSAGNGKFLQENSTMSPQSYPAQDSSVQAVKRFSNEDIIRPVKQQSVAQNQSLPTEIHSQQQLQIFKHPEQTRSKAVKSTHQRNSSTSDASHPSDDEQIEPYNQVKEHNMEDSLLNSIDQAFGQSPSQNEQVMEERTLKTKVQDQDLGLPSSPLQQVSQQGGNALSRISSSLSANAAGHLHPIVEDSSSTSPLSTQAAPLKSSNLNLSSSPTPSCSGVGIKQQGLAKFRSVSPPSEKTSNAVLAQPGSTSKPTLNSSVMSNNKGHTSSVSKLGNSPGNPSSKDSHSSKHRSRTNTTDSKKGDAGNTATNASVSSPAEGHTGEGIISSSRHSSKESGKFLVNSAEKGTVLGKASPVPCPSKLPSHSKLSSSPLLAKQMDQLSSAAEQPIVPQTKPVKPVPKGLPHKTEKIGIISGSSSLKASTVLLPPHPSGTPDRQVPSTNFAPPTLNDEELALLLHQELNSSPRVTRVAKVRQAATAAPHLSVVQASYHSIKRPAAAIALPPASSAAQKDHHTISRRRMREDSSRESSHGVDDTSKADASVNKKQDNTAAHGGKKREKDVADGCNIQKASTMPAAEISSYLSQGVGNLEGQSASDLSCATASNDGERRGSADNVLTLPGLIEEILNEKGHQASYNFICEAVLPHWPKLRKHNGERYAYTSHRQAVLDCLRNRSAWSHLIDRGPKTNVGRKRRRPESVVAVESEIVEEAEGRGLSHDDEGEDPKSGKSPKENEGFGSESWPPSDSGKDIDSTLPEEVRKGKRKARQRRRLAVQARGYGARNLQNREEKMTEIMTVSEEDHEQGLSPLSEEAASNYSEEEEEILVHRGGRHISRRQGSSVDSGDDELGL